MSTNIKYKASVFSSLFSDPDVLRELYCALEGVTLPPDIPITINTLENVLFMGRINDISFEIGGKLVVLVEHQSTINPNMALRLNLYMARLYEKMFREKSLYSGKQLKIPRPEFFVLYNGKAPYPDQEVIRLSDAFEKVELPGQPEKVKPSLELEIRVININEGRNGEIASRCKKLTEYSAFIAKVRSFEQELGSLEEAMKSAIKYCLNNDILSEFLELHSKEVFNMLITEWDTEKAKEVWYEEGLEDGMEKRNIELAKNALSEGLSIDVIRKITGLDEETIKGLSPGK